jgi:hypothetical protein
VDGVPARDSRETCAPKTEDVMIATTHDSFLKATQRGRARKIAIFFAALVGFAIVVGVLIRGFHGRQILRDADSLVEPVEPTLAPVPAPPPKTP